MADHRTASRILEFLLRQPIPDWLANEIFLFLPISAPLDPRLKKTLLLRRILSELSAGRLSERTLHTLELIQEIDCSEGISEPSDPMRAAYCAVAVDLTARFLRGKSSDDDGDFFDAVNRIWNCRVADLERSEAAGLVSEPLKEERRVMEEAVVSPNTRVDVMRRDTEKEALEAVKVYLKEVAEEMGPSSLQLEAKGAISIRERIDSGGDCTLCELNEKSNDLGAGRAGKGCEVGRQEGSMSGGGKEAFSQDGCSTSGFDHLPLPKDIKGKEEPRSAKQHIMVKECPDFQSVAARVRTSGSKETANPQKLDVIQNLIDLKPVPSVDKDVKAMHEGDIGGGSSHSKDHDVVLQSRLIAQNSSELKDMDGNQIRTGVSAPVRTIDKGTTADSTEGTSTFTGENRDFNEVRPPSFMDWNPTARTYEWQDHSTEFPSEKLSNLPEMLHLPRPKKREVPTGKSRNDKDLFSQRKKKRWSSLEEETLRKAVEKYGKGNWTFIKRCHAEVFEDRTAGDLKDKWRNMTRSSQ